MAASRTAAGSKADSSVRPEAPIRRFDVFAEYKRLEAERRGDAPDEARGYGVWIAKVVASRRFRRSRGAAEHGDAGHQRAAADDERRAEPGPHELDGEPQTAATFEREIVRRMGAAFYHEVFAPALRAAFEAGERYEAIRDRIRRGWTP